MARGIQIESLWNGILDTSGNPLAGGKVYSYEVGTTTPKALYTDATLTTPASNPVILDANGQALVYGSGAYKLVVYTSANVLTYTRDNLNYFIDSYPTDTFVNATDYNSGTLTDDTINAAVTALSGAERRLFLKAGTWVIDANCTVPANITLVVARGAVLSISGGATLTINGDLEAGLYNIFSGAGSVAFGTSSCSEAIPHWWSADGAGIKKAIAAHRRVRIPKGSYTTSVDIDITNDYQEVKCDSATITAAANNLKIIHWSASHGLLAGDLKIAGGGFTGLTGLRVSPNDETQTTTRVDQNFNSFRDIHIVDCANGLVLMTGPDVAGADSGCWYNRFSCMHIQNCTTGIWLKDGTNAGSSGNNRNSFYSVRVGQGASPNVGVYLVSGDTCTFMNCSFEGIANGTSPLATPTAVYVASAGAYSGDNNNAQFIGCHFESCTRDVDNRNSYTELVSCNYLTRSFTQLPMLSIGGYDNANVPQIIGGTGGALLQANSQISGYQNHWNWLNNMAVHDKEFYDFISSTAYTWQTYAITTGICTNVATISEYQSKYRRFNGMVDWHFRFQFNASVAGTAVTIQFPIAPNSDLYRLNSTIQMMLVPVGAFGGTGSNQILPAQFSIHSASPSTLSIPAPTANWNTGGNNNNIHGILRYHV